ncbi:uncharacterized abhydrolase domain-containing protein DDB_G0269086-like [Bicyclus anynana]|uniref:Uncharacterized abhydrolase domain-containing protein DDB_G0269086-like n=1 Tax=Bicyclus anynana TaxID=110368 RepID=A0ABM3M7T2_BICAN|nr:uncharacterized abhydrolase domain-containing protein DDB_G0269086-like [Bicyclus anynana]
MENNKDFDCFEHQFVELIGEFQSLSISECKLREALRVEAARAEAAEASRDASERATEDARASTQAATAGTAQGVKTLAAVQDELTTVKMQLDFADRQCKLYEEKYSEMVNKAASLERELEALRPLQAANSAYQRQYAELKERIRIATEEARSEASRLENELRRVESSASAGSKLRERARLAAAAHARERRLASAELQHTAKELNTALAEIARQKVVISELDCRLAKSHEDINKKFADSEFETLIEVKAALESERAGTDRLAKALAAALADNATLASSAEAVDKTQLSLSLEKSSICPIDSFLAE